MVLYKGHVHIHLHHNQTGIYIFQYSPFLMSRQVVGTQQIIQPVGVAEPYLDKLQTAYFD